ncbi:MAG: DinB family protein [Anaerolineales bacterium]|nr:DinB family protein [Anaerolineales bacterium]
MAKQALINEYIQARRTLLAAMEGLTDDEMLRPGAAGYWSVKDIMAHLTAWESELITALVWVEQKKRGAPAIVKIDEIDEWNDEQYHISVARPLQIIREDFEGVAKHLIAAIEALDDDALDNNRRFSWMEGEPLSYLVYENAIWHEEEHAEDIRAWREEGLE